MGGKFPVDCQLCASLSLPFFAYWGAPRHNRRHSFQRTLPRVRLGMPAQEHTCKNRKTCLRPTAVSPPLSAAGEGEIQREPSHSRRSPAFPSKAAPPASSAGSIKKGGAPHRFALPFAISHHSVPYILYGYGIFLSQYIRDIRTLLHKPWQTCRMHCRASLGLDASSAPMVRTIPLARAARSSA